MATELAKVTRDQFSEAIGEAELFEPMSFGELNIGDKFIGLPLPGDNNGHGGFRVTRWLFKKKSAETAIRIKSRIFNYPLNFPQDFRVLKVE